MKKRKIYRFHQLPKKAKGNAASEIAEKEKYNDLDLSHEWEKMREMLQWYLEEAKLDFKEVLIDDTYGIDLDLSSVSMTDNYLENVLSKEQLDKYNEYSELFSDLITHRLFDKYYDKRGYEMELDYDREELDHQDGMAFLLKYSDDEEIKAEFRILHILETELDEESAESLFDYLYDLGQSIAKELTEPIHSAITILIDKMEKSARDAIDYIGSDEFYFDILDCEGSYEEEKYRFNYQGEIVLIDNEFADSDYEEIFLKEAV